MANIDDLLRRVAGDPSFRDRVRNEPGEALRGHDLSTAELRRLDAAVRAGSRAPAAGPPVDPMPDGGTGSAGGLLTAGRLALAGFGVAALGVGLFLGGSGRIADARPERQVARDAVDLRGCPSAAAAAVVGQAHRGDRVFAVARTEDGGWIAIRDLDDLAGPAVWLPAADLAPDAPTAELPVRRCDTDLGGEVTSSDAVTAPTLPGATTTTGPGAAATSSTTTTEPGTTTTTTPDEVAVPPMTFPGGAPVPTTSPPVVPSVPGTTPATPTTTTPTDRQGPVASVQADRGFVYTDGSSEQQCATRTTVDLTVAASDPSGVGLSAVRWSYTGRNGVVKTGTAASLGGGRFRLGPLFDQVPLSGSTAVDLAVTATDGRGNATTATTSVQLRAHGDTCIG